MSLCPDLIILMLLNVWWRLLTTHCARLAAIGGLISSQYQPMSRPFGHLNHITMLVLLLKDYSAYYSKFSYSPWWKFHVTGYPVTCMVAQCCLSAAVLYSDVTKNSPDTAAKRCNACHSLVIKWGNPECFSETSGAIEDSSNLFIGSNTKCYQVKEGGSPLPSYTKGREKEFIINS